MMINTTGLVSEAAQRVEALFSSNRVSHAILVSGSLEADRLNTARFIAGVWVCESNGAVPCGECRACRKASAGTHPDIHIYDKPADKKQYRKEQLARLCEDVYVTPNEAQQKVIFIKEMQNMNEECQNLLLKVLEEPPEYTVFVLSASSRNVLLPTVRSRVTLLELGEGAAPEHRDEKAVQCACAMAQALSSQDEFDMLAATAAVQGDTKQLCEALYELSLIIRDAFMLSSGVGGNGYSASAEQSKLLASTFSLSRLLKMYDTVSGLIRAADANQNQALLLTRVSGALRGV